MDIPPPRASLVVQRHPDGLEIIVAGSWTLDAAMPPRAEVMRAIHSSPKSSLLRFEMSSLQRWDSALVTEIIAILQAAKHQGLQVETFSLLPAIQNLLKLVYAIPENNQAAKPQHRLSWLDEWQSAFNQILQEAAATVEFVGELCLSVLDVIKKRSHFRRMDLWLQIQDCGPSALPIVTVISLLVGLILAFVGAVQLALFGAQMYIANLVSLGMTREMGCLMTAIIMSGRTGAAYAAQLGTMRVNDEIDALRTMNLEPLAFLVLPRMLALILIMPLLCLYADLMGIVGGALVSLTVFDISTAEYIDRTIHAVQMKDFLIGFVKSSVFGVLIAFSGCMRGMQCGRSASAVGDAATSAVVTSIVFIVIADSIMTLICNRFGI